MVAITVILAAVIAAFVLGLGDTSDPGPQVSFDYDYDNGSDQLEVTVSGGDTFEAGRLTFEGTGLGNNQSSSFAEVSRVGQSSDFDPESSVSAGDRVVIGDVSSDFELDVTFTSDGGGDSSIVSSRTGPDAN
jgi:FlaG/FlaF family flagellin (archaellin)